ncbi:unnamed protein product, partial [Amoebophrya sp. A120]|eukprot:GSA120T00013272001.1
MVTVEEPIFFVIQQKGERLPQYRIIEKWQRKVLMDLVTGPEHYHEALNHAPHLLDFRRCQILQELPAQEEDTRTFDFL